MASSTKSDSSFFVFPDGSTRPLCQHTGLQIPDELTPYYVDGNPSIGHFYDPIAAIAFIHRRLESPDCSKSQRSAFIEQLTAIASEMAVVYQQSEFTLKDRLEAVAQLKSLPEYVSLEFLEEAESEQHAYADRCKAAYVAELESRKSQLQKRKERLETAKKQPRQTMHCYLYVDDSETAQHSVVTATSDVDKVENCNPMGSTVRSVFINGKPAIAIQKAVSSVECAALREVVSRHPGTLISEEDFEQLEWKGDWMIVSDRKIHEIKKEKSEKKEKTAVEKRPRSSKAAADGEPKPRANPKIRKYEDKRKLFTAHFGSVLGDFESLLPKPDLTVASKQRSKKAKQSEESA